MFPNDQGTVDTQYVGSMESHIILYGGENMSRYGLVSCSESLLFSKAPFKGH